VSRRQRDCHPVDRKHSGRRLRELGARSLTTSGSSGRRPSRDAAVRAVGSEVGATRRPCRRRRGALATRPRGETVWNGDEGTTEAGARPIATVSRWEGATRSPIGSPTSTRRSPSRASSATAVGWRSRQTDMGGRTLGEHPSGLRGGVAPRHRPSGQRRGRSSPKGSRRPPAGFRHRADVALDIENLSSTHRTLRHTCVVSRRERLPTTAPLPPGACGTVAAHDGRLRPKFCGMRRLTYAGYPFTARLTATVFSNSRAQPAIRVKERRTRGGFSVGLHMSISLFRFHSVFALGFLRSRRSAPPHRCRRG
jgi:hypothetical protein